MRRSRPLRVEIGGKAMKVECFMSEPSDAVMSMTVGV